MSGPWNLCDAGPRTADEHICVPQSNFHEETLRPILSLKQPETNTFLPKPGNQLGKKKPGETVVALVHPLLVTGEISSWAREFLHDSRWGWLVSPTSLHLPCSICQFHFRSSSGWGSFLTCLIPQQLKGSSQRPEDEAVREVATD